MQSSQSATTPKKLTLSEALTLAKTEMIYQKDIGAQVAMDFL